MSLSVLTTMTQTSGVSTTMSTQMTINSPWRIVDRSDRSHYRHPTLVYDRMVNIHLNQGRRGSLDSATFTSEQMQQFINELDAAHRSHRYVEGDTVLNLTAQAARDMITFDMFRNLSPPTRRSPGSVSRHHG